MCKINRPELDMIIRLEALLSISCDETFCLCDPRYEFLTVPSSVVGCGTAEHLWAAIFKRGVFCQTLMEDKNALFRITLV